MKMPKVVDDRDSKQQRTHTVLVVAHDTFLSGWGNAKGGVSLAAWACKAADADQVFRWVSGRSDMRRVHFAAGKQLYPGKNGHAHIYVVNEGHPAIGGE